MPNRSNNLKNNPGSSSGMNMDKAGSMSNQSGNDLGKGRSNQAGAGQVSQNRGDEMARSQTIGKPDMGMSRPASGHSSYSGGNQANTHEPQEPKRQWGQEEFHGNNADWGKEGDKIGPDLRWGETSHEGDARGTQPDAGERGKEEAQNSDSNS